MKSISRFRPIKKWGNSLVVVLSKMDVEDFNVKEKDYIDLTDCVIISNEIYKKKKENKKNETF